MAFRVGQLVKLSSAPNDDPRDHTQVYMVLSIIQKEPEDMANVLQFNLNAGEVPISSVPVSELIEVTYNTAKHFGEEVMITKRSNVRVQGLVIKVHENEIMLSLVPQFGGLQSNIRVTILDSKGKKHTGCIFNPEPGNPLGEI